MKCYKSQRMIKDRYVRVILYVYVYYVWLMEENNWGYLCSYLFSSVNHTYTRSTLCIEHCFTDFKFKPLIRVL